jgi:hypothetical protein
MKRASIALLGLTFILSACASAPRDPGPRGFDRPDRRGPPGGRGDPGGPGGGPPRQQLFISPAGEPYRAPPGMPYPLSSWWSRIDPGNAGQVGAAALVGDAERFFAVLDVNHDGVIDGFETTAYENKTVPEILQNAGPGGLQGAAPYSLLNDAEPVRSADADLDGKVTLAEFRQKARDVFIRLDRNHDGQLAKAELPVPMIANPDARRLRPGPGGRGPGGPGGPGGRGGPGGGRGGGGPGRGV